MPVPVADRSKARVYGQSLAGIAGSNPHSSRGVLPTVVRPCVWSRNLQSEAAQTRKGCKCRIEEEEEGTLPRMR
jgi:hypothetical protein